MKPILLGIDNPYDSEALYPIVPGCAGWNLWKISELSRNDYVEKFDRRNLMTSWDVELAPKAAREFHSSLPPGADVTLLGQFVRSALGLPQVLIHPIVVDGITYRQIPHPSGRNIFYNHPVNRIMVRLLLQWLIANPRTETFV